MMEKMISRCGLICTECEAYLATKNDDDAKRAEVAQAWSKRYGADIKAQDINCSGCLSEGGVVFSHCTVCGIRKCASDRGVANCAHCDDYACEQLEEFLKFATECREQLEQIRQARQHLS